MKKAKPPRKAKPKRVYWAVKDFGERDKMYRVRTIGLHLFDSKQDAKDYLKIKDAEVFAVHVMPARKR
jgi:hypothetical protein